MGAREHARGSPATRPSWCAQRHHRLLEAARVLGGTPGGTSCMGMWHLVLGHPTLSTFQLQRILQRPYAARTRLWEQCLVLLKHPTRVSTPYLSCT